MTPTNHVWNPSLFGNWQEHMLFFQEDKTVELNKEASQ